MNEQTRTTTKKPTPVHHFACIMWRLHSLLTYSQMVLNYTAMLLPPSNVHEPEPHSSKLAKH